MTGIMNDGIRVFSVPSAGMVKPGSVFKPFPPTAPVRKPCGYIAGTGGYFCSSPPTMLIDPDASDFPHTGDYDNPRGYKGYVSVLCTYHFNRYVGVTPTVTLTPALNAAIAWNKLLKAHCAS